MRKKDSVQSGDETFLSSDKIISLIFDGSFDEARSLIDKEQNRLPKGEAHRLMALTAVLHERLGSVDEGIELMRQAVREKPTWLPHLYRLSVMLMDAKHWSDAVAVLDEIIALSLADDDVYFLDESRFRKAVCLKMLGRSDEFKRLKDELPAGMDVFIGGKLYQIDDFR